MKGTKYMEFKQVMVWWADDYLCLCIGESYTFAMTPETALEVIIAIGKNMPRIKEILQKKGRFNHGNK